MLTKEKVIAEHDSLVRLFGGSLGINYEGIIEYAVEKYNISLNKKEAAIEFFYEVLIGHPFTDGNKRTAVHFLEHLLEVNGYRLTASNVELVSMALTLAKMNEISNKKETMPLSFEDLKKHVLVFVTP